MFRFSGPSNYPLHPAAPTPPPQMRAVSGRVLSRTPSTRSRLHSANTVVIHSDIDDGADQTPTQAPAVPLPPPDGMAGGPASRTRKAKDTQFRLGVGRPSAAGGSGARAVTTKVVSVARSKRGKPSRSGRPGEATIVEGPSIVVYLLSTS
jgi:hypothetical protein